MAVAAEARASSEESVETILARAASGDDDAIAYLYRRYVPALVYYAQRQQAADPEGSADLAFLDAVNALPTMRSWSEATFRAYAYKATRSRISGDSRRNRVDTVALDDHLDLAAPESIEETVISQEGFDGLLKDLSPGQRDVIVHRFLGGFSVAETAARLGRSPGAVKQLQFQGINRLRAAFVVATVIVLIAGAVALTQTSQSVVTDVPAGVDEQPVEDGLGPLPDVNISDSDGQSNREPFAVEVDQDGDSGLSSRSITVADNPGPTTTLLGVSPQPRALVDAAGDKPDVEQLPVGEDNQASGEVDAATSEDSEGAVVDSDRDSGSGDLDDGTSNDPDAGGSSESNVGSDTEVVVDDTVESKQTTQSAEPPSVVEESDDRSFPNQISLRNYRTDRCASVSSRGGDVIVKDCHGGEDQRFELIEDDNYNDAYQIVLAESGRCLERGYLDDRVNAFPASCDGSEEQSWQIEAIDGGWHKIRTTESGYCLDTDRDGGVSTTNVGVRRCDSTSSQKWMIQIV